MGIPIHYDDKAERLNQERGIKVEKTNNEAPVTARSTKETVKPLDKAKKGYGMDGFQVASYEHTNSV